MQEVTCFHCGYLVQITPDDERCSVCGTDLRRLLTPEQASLYFYQRAIELADNGDPQRALEEIERGLSVTRSVELHLLAAILAERINDFQEMRKHVAAIPIDDPLRGEGEWLLRSHQSRQREQRESRRRPQGWSISDLGGRIPSSRTPSYVPPELVEAYTAQDAFYTEQNLTEKYRQLDSEPAPLAPSTMMGALPSTETNAWRPIALWSFLLVLLTGGSMLFLQYQPQLTDLASQWLPSLEVPENPTVRPVVDEPVRDTISVPSPMPVAPPTAATEMVEQNKIVEPLMDLPVIIENVLEETMTEDSMTEDSTDTAFDGIVSEDIASGDEDISPQEATPTYELILRPTPRVDPLQGEAVVESDPVKALYVIESKPFDLEGHLNALGRGELATLPVEARIENNVLILEGIVSRAEEREQLAILAATVPNVQEISVSNIRLRLPSVYVVVEGDNLWNIAEKLYGESGYREALYKANRDVMDTPNSLQVGMKLTVPSVD